MDLKLKKTNEIDNIERMRSEEYENQNIPEFGKLTLRKTETARSNLSNTTDRCLESKCLPFQANDFEVTITKR